MDDSYDVVVVGGGAAGLGGALTLARARRSVLVVDAGEPRNAPAGQVHNFLTRDGTPPAELVAIGRGEVTRAGATIVTGRVAAATGADGHFQATLDDGTEVRARRLLVATGLVDELPDLPGLAKRWGRDVLHCPYCHGWEVRDRRIGVLATGPRAVRQAELWRQWSPRVLLLTHHTPVPTAAEAERLAARAIPVVDGPVVALELSADTPTGDALTGVRLASGELVALDVLVVAPRMVAGSPVLASLGLEPEPVRLAGDVIGAQVPAGADGATAVPGVWVAGNVADLHAQVVMAAAAGARAAVAINADLVEEDTRLAVDDYRTQLRILVDAAAWEERYRSRPAIRSGRPNPVVVAEGAELTPGAGRGLRRGRRRGVAGRARLAGDRRRHLRHGTGPSRGQRRRRWGTGRRADRLAPGRQP